MKDAIEHLAESVEATAASVARLNQEIAQARASTHNQLAGIRRLTLIIIAGLTLLFIVSLGVGYTLYLVQDATDPNGSLVRGSEQRMGVVIASLSVENDCRSRRASAGLPAPTAGTPCSAQTPPQVYPGKGP